jgi:myo-inositol-1-phosphate synthase
MSTSDNGNGERRLGVWIVGALGSVSALVAAGLEAMKAGLAGPTGLVTSAPDFEGTGLADPASLVLGGHEVRGGDWAAAAEEYARANGVLSREMLDAARPGLLAASADLRPGISINCGDAIRKLAPLPTDLDRRPLAEIVASIQKDIREFKERRGLDDVIVVNLASAEPEAALPRELSYLESLSALIAQDRRDVFPASVLYAYAALDAGFPYVNFTSSVGSSLASLEDLAVRRNVPHAGQRRQDGRDAREDRNGADVRGAAAQGSLVGGAQPPREPRWAGAGRAGEQSREGERQGRGAAGDPGRREGALAGADRLRSVAGRLEDGVGLHPLRGLPGDADVAAVHWQGCDSILAAPLVLDMVRLADLAARRGEKGPMVQLAPFFKAPLGGGSHDFHVQMDDLVAYAAEHRAAGARRTARR